MIYIVTEITEEIVTFKREDSIIEIPQGEIDTLSYLEVNKIVDFTENDIKNKSCPYKISRARRLDIRAYRQEEADCGNI